MWIRTRVQQPWLGLIGSVVSPNEWEKVSEEDVNVPEGPGVSSSAAPRLTVQLLTSRDPR